MEKRVVDGIEWTRRGKVWSHTDVVFDGTKASGIYVRKRSITHPAMLAGESRWRRFWIWLTNDPATDHIGWAHADPINDEQPKKVAEFVEKHMLNLTELWAPIGEKDRRVYPAHQVDDLILYVISLGLQRACGCSEETLPEAPAPMTHKTWCRFAEGK